MKILFTVDEDGYEEYIGPFSSENEAEEWAHKELSAFTRFEILDITVPKEATIPGSISIDLETLQMLDLSPLLKD